MTKVGIDWRAFVNIAMVHICERNLGLLDQLSDQQPLDRSSALRSYIVVKLSSHRLQ
jgi:hypothetical protein